MAASRLVFMVFAWREMTQGQVIVNEGMWRGGSPLVEDILQADKCLSSRDAMLYRLPHPSGAHFVAC